MMILQGPLSILSPFPSSSSSSLCRSRSTISFLHSNPKSKCRSRSTISFLHSNPKSKCKSSFIPSLPLVFFLGAPDPLPSTKLRAPQAAIPFLPDPHCLLAILPADPWSPSTDSQSIASQLFAASLFPYLGFLYHLTKSKSAPKLTLFGFYFLLVFVAATIPAGIYAKLHYGTSLSNVDWLHGGAESMLTLTNLFIVLGLRGAIRDPDNREKASEEERLETAEDESVKVLK